MATRSTQEMPDREGRAWAPKARHQAGAVRPATSARPPTNRPVPVRSLEQRLNDPSEHLSFLEKWSPLVQLKLLLFFSCCFIALSLAPNSIWSPEAHEFTYVIGIIGIWRYGWWLNHWVRAKIYQHIAYPRIRARGQAVWQSGWRPDRMKQLFLLPIAAMKLTLLR